jgi:hypothetical protein
MVSPRAKYIPVSKLLPCIPPFRKILKFCHFAPGDLCIMQQKHIFAPVLFFFAKNCEMPVKQRCVNIFLKLRGAELH